MDWNICKRKHLVKEVHVDRNLIKSIKKGTSKKLHAQSLLKLDNVTASAKISLTYEVLRELLEALSISKGYKIYNHECYYAFLTEILHESAMGDKFSEFRKVRHAVNYYGREITAKEAKPLLRNMLLFIEKLYDKLNAVK